MSAILSFYTPKLFLEAVELCFLVRENVGKCSDDKHFFASDGGNLAVGLLVREGDKAGAAPSVITAFSSSGESHMKPQSHLLSRSEKWVLTAKSSQQQGEPSMGRCNCG